VSGKFARITPDLLARKGNASPSVAGDAAREPVGAIPLRMRLESEIVQPQRTALPPGHDLPVAGDDGTSTKRFFYTPEETGGSGGGGSDIHSEKPRRIVLTLTAHEYETLGLVAVKKNTTRHQLAQSALDAYFEWLVSEYGEACSCIVGGALCRCECGSDQREP
jgi:hypothetical protein